MCRNVGVTRADHRQVVDQIAEFREHFADLDAGLAFLLELEWGLHGYALVSGNGAAVVLRKSGFGIPGINVGRGALREDMDDVFGLGGEMRLARGESGHLLD